MKWGYKVPEGVETAWGARAIFGRDYMDLLPDRQDAIGTEENRKRLADLLNGGVLQEMQKNYAGFVESRAIVKYDPDEVVLYEDDMCMAWGNSNGSHGYFYVTAWLK